MPGITNLEALTAYRDHMLSAGLSPGTIRLRLYQLDRFASCATVSLLCASTDDLIGFLSVQDWKPDTRKAMRSAFRSFYAWALAHEYVANDPSLKLPKVRVPKGEPRPVPEAILAKALEVADDETWRMLVLGAYAGLRRAEIARVHSQEVTDQGLRVTGKGGHTRVVPIHPLVGQALDGVNGWAFPSSVRPGRPVGPDYVHDRVSSVLPSPWSTHTLRHRFASRAYAGTRDLRAVQMLLGHSTPETTARYVLVPDDMLKATVAGL